MKYNRISYKVLTCSAIAFTLLATGCTDSGIASVGNNVYYLSKGDMWSFGGAPSSKVVASVYSEAKDFCAKNSLEFKELKHSYTPTSYGQSPTYTIEFKCMPNN